MDDDVESSPRPNALLTAAGGGATSAHAESMSDGRGGRIFGAIALNTLCILPVFLIGAMGESVRSDLQIDEAVLGFALSGYWLVAALAAFPMALLAGRLGAVKALRLAGVGAFVLCLTFVWAAQSAASLMLTLAVVGLAPALATPAVNLVIRSGVRPDRRAVVFAAASTSPVAALMVAGAIGPVLEVSLGWRQAIVVGGVATVLIVLCLRRDVPHQRQPDTRPPAAPSLRPLVAMMAGVLGCNMALGGATAFAVVAAPSVGLDIAAVSFIVSGCACASIVFRLLFGVIVDRRGWDPFPAAWMMMLTGAAGFLLMAWGFPGGFVAGLALVLVPGWSWISLLVHGVTSRYPDAVAPASGVVQVAYFVGGVVGPAAMGILIATASYSIAWLTMGAASLLAALSVIAQKRRLPPFRQA